MDCFNWKKLNMFHRCDMQTVHKDHYVRANGWKFIILIVSWDWIQFSLVPCMEYFPFYFLFTDVVCKLKFNENKNQIGISSAKHVTVLQYSARVKLACVAAMEQNSQKKFTVRWGIRRKQFLWHSWCWLCDCVYKVQNHVRCICESVRA